MSRQQIRSQYSGTFLGMMWAILHPLLLLSVFWLVFTMGFKTQVIGNRPFLLSLFCGLLVWMPFGEAIGGGGAIYCWSLLLNKEDNFSGGNFAFCQYSLFYVYSFYSIYSSGAYVHLLWLFPWTGRNYVALLFFLFNIFIVGFSMLIICN